LGGKADEKHWEQSETGANRQQLRGGTAWPSPERQEWSKKKREIVDPADPGGGDAHVRVLRNAKKKKHTTHMNHGGGEGN